MSYHELSVSDPNNDTGYNPAVTDVVKIIFIRFLTLDRLNLHHHHDLPFEPRHETPDCCGQVFRRGLFDNFSSVSDNVQVIKKPF